MRTLFFALCILGVNFTFCRCLLSITWDGHSEITQLKDLCIQTTLVADGRPQAAIVAPMDGRYDEAVRTVQQAIKRCAGSELPIVGDDSGDPQALLADRSFIALGNMSTSRFVDTLYRHWYTFLDLRYPGAGGWGVRSLHNPYGTGHNVILLGDSDDEGVAEAARQFAADLKPRDPLSVGWLMKVQLGEGMQLPETSETLYAWRDNRRLDAKGNEVPRTIYGWNPISVQAALYYMTGQEEYLREFVRLALPDPDNVPKEILTHTAFHGMEHPLVENTHYRAHLMDPIWDLIEESPLLADEVRLKITNELRAHQNRIDAEDDWLPTQGAGRHGLYDALCIYTGSRYFAKYYPAPRWQKRLSNLRRFFSWWLKHPTWVASDSLFWLNTFAEPVLEYFLMADPDAFVNSGAARTMMSGLEILWTGMDDEESNRYQSIGLMHKAAYLLKDGRYVYMARKAGYDFGLFRIGQSWWPDPDLKIEPPLDRVGVISVMSLAEPLAQRVQAPFDAQQGYQFLSYRTGVGPDDGFMLLDGYNGGGRNPHHVSALKLLRNTGRLLLSGYGNQVVILRDGMVEGHVARAARLDASVALCGLAYVRSVVPDAAYSEWKRDILWVDDHYTLVADTVTASEGGKFEITCQWEPMDQARLSQDDSRWAQLSDSNRTTVVCAQPISLSVASGQLRQTSNEELRAGESQTLISVIYGDSDEGRFDYRLQPVGERAALISGKEAALFTAGRFAMEGLDVDAWVGHFSSDRISIFEGLRISGEKVLAEATAPMSLVWDLDEGKLALECSQDTALSLAVTKGAHLRLDGREMDAQSDKDTISLQLGAGSHVITGAAPREGVARTIAAALAAFAGAQAPETPSAESGIAAVEWPPTWETDLRSSVTHIEIIDAGAGGQATIWSATEAPALSLMAADGELMRTIDLPAKLNALVWADFKPAHTTPRNRQDVIAVAGGDDDLLRAFSASGDVLWEGESKVSDHFKMGDRYEAPWFTDPAVKYGILSLMVADVTGSGQAEIVLGRASTIEYWSLDGELIARVPAKWGDCADLALLETEKGPRVLAGTFFSGYDSPIILDAERKVIARGYYVLPEGSTRMMAWMQRGIVALHAVDLDDDGTQEVVVARSGHWNDVRVFNNNGSKCLWQRSFGPSYPRSRFIGDLAVGDLDGDAALEVAAGLANGWTCCFDADGTPLWTRKFTSPVTRMLALSGHLVVGFENGRVALLDAKGETIKAAEFGSAITSMISTERRWPGEPLILAGTKSGKIAALTL